MKQISEKKMHRSSRMRYLWITLLMLLAGSGVTLAGLLDGNVARVGTEEYATIEEAIAAWGPGKTLTLLQDVTTTSTVTVEVNATKSTQNWTLNLGDHTWTASGCNAFQLYAAGGTVMNQNYGLKIYANQNGGITASGKYCIQCTYDNSKTRYRPRLEIHGGTYEGNYIIYYYSSSWNNSNIENGPSTHISVSNDGSEPVFNGNFGLFKCPLTINAGYFNGTSFNTYPVGSTADTYLKGGHFKTISAFPSASNNKGIIFGNYKVFVKADASIDVVNGAPATYEAKATKTLLLSTNQSVNYSDYVYYEKADDAIKKYSSGTIDIILSEGVTATESKSFRSGTLTIDTSAEGSDYTGNITLTGTSAKFIIKYPEGKGHYGVTASTGQLHVEETVAEGIVTRTYSVRNVTNPEAKVGDTGYSTVYDAFYAIDGTTDNKTIVLLKDVTNAGIVTNGTAVNAAGKTVATFDLNGHSIGIGSVAAGNNADYTMTIIDSSADKTGTVTNSDASLFILALTGLNDYSGTYTLKIQAGTWMFNPETVVIKGETHNLVDEGYYARDNSDGTWTVGELPSVAKIGDVKYRTLDAAVAAANEGETIEVIKAGDYKLPNLPKNVTIEGKADGVVSFTHTTAGSIASVPNGATFKNVTFNWGNVNYHGFQHAGTINMDGCTLNGKFFSYADMNFTNCQFTQSNSDYHMWNYSGNQTYTNCTFTNSATGKFLNVYNESGATKYTITCTDCKFINNASAANKAAINVKATSGSNLLAYDVIINNCTTEGAFPEASTSDALYVLNSIAQVDDRTASGVDNITVTQDGVLIYPVAVAQIGDVKYPTLQSAVNAAQQMGGNVTITLLDDISGETVTIKEVANFKVTIDGKKDANTNYTIDGQIIIDGLRGNGGDIDNGASVTLQNIAFINGEAKDVILASHYPHNLTIQDCTYTGSAASSNNWFVNVSDGPLYGTTVKNVTVEHSRLIQLDLSADAVFENIVATNDVTCGFNIKTSDSDGKTGTVLIKNCQVTTAKYAFRDYKDSYNGTITLEDNTFISTSEESDEGAIVNRGGAVGTGHINVVSGTYTGHLKVLNNKEGVLALSGGYFSEEFPQNYIAEDLVAQGKACVPATDKEGYYTIGDPHYVAQIGETKYVSLQAAVTAAQTMGGAQTITLLDNITGETVTINEVADFKVTIDGKKDDSSNYTVDAVIIVDGLRGNGGSTTNGASVTLQNIAFVKTTATDGIQASHYPHHLTIQDCTYSGANSDKWFFNASVDGPLYGVTIKNVTVEHARLIYANLAEDAVFQNITATNDCKVGFNVKTSGTALIENCQVTTGKYAFRDYSDGYEGTFTLKDNNFISTSTASDEGAIVNRGGAVGTAHINVESGTYVGAVKVMNNKEGVLAISDGHFSAPLGNAEYANYFAEGRCGVNGLYPEDEAAPNGVGDAVASVAIGEKTNKFATFEAAVEAAGNENVITLLANIPDAYTMSEGQTLKVKKDGKSVTIKAPEGFVLKSSTADDVTTYTIVEPDYMFTNAKTGAITYYTINSLSALNTGGTFKLLKDATRTTRTASSAMAGNTKITFDLNGHTLTYTSTDASFLLSGNYGGETSPKFIEIVDNSETGGGKLVMNAEIEITGRYYDVTIGEGVTIEGNSVLIDSKYYNKLTVEGSINGGDEFAVVTNGNTENANINIKNGAVLTSTGTAMYLPGTGTTTIEEGATITGATGIYVKSGTLNIEGGDITGNGEKKDYEYWDNGCHSTGQALVVDNCGYPGGEPTVNITGGKFTTVNNDCAIGSYGYGDGNAALEEFVHGGYFSTELPRAICEAGKKTVPSETVENYYELGEIVYVAQIGDVKYESLADAVAAVPTDGTETTILMIADDVIQGNAVTIETTKNVVLDLNGKTITGVVLEGKSSQTILNKGTLIVTDSSEGKTGTLTNEVSDELAGSPGNGKNWYSNVITNNGTLTVNAGNIVNTGTGGACYAIDNITNGTICSPVLNIVGGNISAKKVAVRMFCNSTTNVNTVNVTGGNITSENAYAIQTQQANTSANKAALNISGGTISGLYAWCDYGDKDTATQFDNTSYSITGGLFSGYMWSYATYYCGMEGFISGGYFDNEVGGDLVAPGKACVDNTDEATKENYPYTIGEAEVYYSWVDNGATVGEYTLFTKPFDNNWLMDGEFITLLKNITMDKDVVCQLTSGAFTLTFGEYDIDLNGHVFPIPLGVTILTDKQTDIFSATDPDYKVEETATETGYAYTIVPKVYVAQYNNVKYETLQAALDAAEAADDPNMVIDLLADATLDITAWSGTTNALSIGTENTESITINGNNHKLTFNQKNSDWNNVATMNDAQTKLILNDMAITNSGHNNGPWNRHDINFNCDVTLNNVTSDKALAFKNSATLKDVTVEDQPGSIYGIWISPRVEGQTINIDGLTLTAERGIKIDDEYVDSPALTTLNIKNATFNTTKKAAILVKNAGGTVVNAGEGIDISNAKADAQNLVWVDEDRATEYYKVTTNGATMKPESKEEDYVASLRRGDQIRGYYETFAAAYASSDYQTGDFYQLHKTTTESVSVDKELTIIKNGYTADNVTAAEGFQREETLKKIVISPTVPEHPYEIADGYYRIKNLGNGNYVNVIGRRSATISTSEADALSLAGTVIKVNAPEGKVETLRSQAVDIPHYAERAMTYVPEFVEMVVQKLGVEGSGEILGTTGVDAIMDKFNKNFDYHLHTEQAGDGAVRIYGKTPRMKPVVEFYEENKDKVDAKLPKLEEAINDAIDKVVDKLGRGESLRNSFNLHEVWERMSGTLTEPVNEASKVAFMQEVLMDEAYVWDFGYQAVMIYVEKVEKSSYFNEMPAELKKYWNLAKQTHPDFKYYIVQKDGQMDIISEGNIDIINDNDRTKWVLEPAEDFDVDFTIGNMDGEYFATIYTDFGYQLPSGVTAYKVTGIDDNDVAQIEEIGQAVAAQTPVLLKSTTGSGTKKLTIGNYGTSVSGNQLHGADWVINEYDIKNSTVQGLFEIVASVSQSVANEYDYLTSLNSGTVGNKYFFPVTVDGQLSDAYKAKTGNEMNDTPIHYLGVTEEGKVAFVKSWDTIAANAVYMFNETIDPIYLDEPEYPANIAEGYYRIKNDGNNSYVNVRGRRTATVNATEADTKTLPGTVLKVKATNGEVEILRSQAVDLPYYAQRAMSYVPDVVELVVNKLGVDGSGEILGSTGVEAIMQKFNESFDYHLHVEFSSPEAAEGTDTLSNLRIYGKTPSMRPVVEFYQEHKDQVDAKLPMLESEINAAIQKVVEKAGMGSSLLNSFKLETIWTRMGGTLTKPTDNASKLAFLKEVLASEANVWNFAYQTATFYMEKVEGSSVFDQIPAEIRQYWNLAKQVHPNFKYYIVQKDGKMDFISEGNIDIQNNAARTTWSLEPITKFTVNIPETNSKLVGKDKKEYYTTLYTDFGYQLPEGVTALKVTEIKDVQELGLAVTEEIGREVAPQTPVLIKSETAGDITLTIGDNFGSAVTGNLLHGADWLINEFEINTPSLEGLFNIFKKISASTAEQYEYLLRRNSGTVNNKYFFPISAEDIAAGYKNKTGNVMEDTPIRILDKNGKFLAFYDSWENLPSNAVFIYSEKYKPVFLYLIGDVDRDGDIDLDDVNATIDIDLNRDTEENNYDYEAADVDEEYEKINLNDINTLIDLVLNRIKYSELLQKLLGE